MNINFTLKIFGITVLSWRRHVETPPAPALDTDQLYREFAERFTAENKETWAKDLAQQLSDAVAKMRAGGSRP